MGRNNIQNRTVVHEQRGLPQKVNPEGKLYMFSSRLMNFEFESARVHVRRAFARQTASMILLTAMCSAVLIPVALAQTGPSSRVAMQEVKSKVRVQNPKPLESDALYVCTLSGFGNLAHCYLR